MKNNTLQKNVLGIFLLYVYEVSTVHSIYIDIWIRYVLFGKYTKRNIYLIFYQYFIKYY